jgi:hypothetical protein
MKKINLFFDFEFTSLSPDAQPISLGIVNDEWFPGVKQKIKGDESHLESKSFYAEFSNAEMNRCDDWVKENVVSKLRFINYTGNWCNLNYGLLDVFGNTEFIIKELSIWLSQFKDYEITFVGDCLTRDWYHLLQLIGEWEKIPGQISVDLNSIPPNLTIEEFVNEWEQSGSSKFVENHPNIDMQTISEYRIGLPKLPKNISPVPLDLNDLIAFKKGISVKEAFELNREWLANDYLPNEDVSIVIGSDMVKALENKHNALWDAQITKTIYNKIK